MLGPLRNPDFDPPRPGWPLLAVEDCWQVAEVLGNPRAAFFVWP